MPHPSVTRNDTWAIQLVSYQSLDVRQIDVCFVFFLKIVEEADKYSTRYRRAIRRLKRL